MSERPVLKHGDCLPLMRGLESASIDLVYLDPPFFTNKVHRLSTRDRAMTFRFDDLWNGYGEYAGFLFERLGEARRLLRDTGSIFLHCDRNASHVLRALLDKVFGEGNFRSEIIWTFRRWSNGVRGLLPSHHTIFFYSKTGSFKFNPAYVEYSESTNVDQILQRRCRDKYGKTVYERTTDGDPVTSGPKKGVPLGDVWDIPFLNPKAKERSGYPTQKPLILLERIISLVTDPDDLVLDPFCGSGTTLVAAQMLGRRSMGFDVSPEAVKLAAERLDNPVRTESELLRKGRCAYRSADEEALSLLVGLNIVPVHRNSGIDALLVEHFDGKPVPVRVQRRWESLSDAARSLDQAARKKGARRAFLVRTVLDNDMFVEGMVPGLVAVIDAPSLGIAGALSGEPGPQGRGPTGNWLQGVLAPMRRDR
jgi:site-specific DNA-methyltransferase (adenine-specific)